MTIVKAVSSTLNSPYSLLASSSQSPSKFNDENKIVGSISQLTVYPMGDDGRYPIDPPPLRPHRYNNPVLDLIDRMTIPVFAAIMASLLGILIIAEKGRRALGQKMKPLLETAGIARVWDKAIVEQMPSIFSSHFVSYFKAGLSSLFAPLDKKLELIYEKAATSFLASRVAKRIVNDDRCIDKLTSTLNS